MQSAAGWQTLLDFGKASDAKTLSDWKDELGNLLTFVSHPSAINNGLIPTCVIDRSVLSRSDWIYRSCDPFVAGGLWGEIREVIGPNIHAALILYPWLTVRQLYLTFGSQHFNAISTRPPGCAHQHTVGLEPNVHTHGFLLHHSCAAVA